MFKKRSKSIGGTYARAHDAVATDGDGDGENEEQTLDSLLRVKRHQQSRKLSRGISVTTEVADISNTSAKRSVLSSTGSLVGEKFHSDNASAAKDHMEHIKQALMDAYVADKMGLSAPTIETVISRDDALYILPDELRVTSTLAESASSRLAWSTGIAEVEVSTRPVKRKAVQELPNLKHVDTGKNASSSLAAFRFGIFDSSKRQPKASSTAIKPNASSDQTERKKSEDNWALQQFRKRNEN